MMNTPSRIPSVRHACAKRQHGIVLFFALIALVTIMLAAVALVRSVDTATVIAGNLAFKQAATASGDGGLEGARAWIRQKATVDATKDPWIDATHALNVTDATNGYYSNLDPTMDFSADNTWAQGVSAPNSTEVPDASGNSARYIIQRMCRVANQVVSDGNCLFGNTGPDTGPMDGGEPRPIVSGQKYVMQRITIRVKGPRNTVSYIQGFMY